MTVEDATSGTHPALRTQRRRAQAERARQTRANLKGVRDMAEEDTEAAIRWTQSTLLQARDAMMASLGLWMWPSDGQDSEGNPGGDPGLHETTFDLQYVTAEWEQAFLRQARRAAFFNSLKSKVGHIMARASALRVNLNLQLSAPSLPRPSARTKHAHLLYALNLSNHILPPRPGA